LQGSISCPSIFLSFETEMWRFGLTL
jgi:hypothetical protein